MFAYTFLSLSDMWANDIALLKLKEVIPHGSDDMPHIQSVTLPGREDTEFPPDNTICVMKGWGCTESGKKHGSSAKYNGMNQRA